MYVLGGNWKLGRRGCVVKTTSSCFACAVRAKTKDNHEVEQLFDLRRRQYIKLARYAVSMAFLTGVLQESGKVGCKEWAHMEDEVKPITHMFWGAAPFRPRPSPLKVKRRFANGLITLPGTEYETSALSKTPAFASRFHWGGL